MTPPVADGALPGISRIRLIEAGLIAEWTLTAADLARIQAGLAVNALSCRASSQYFFFAAYAGSRVMPRACQHWLVGITSRLLMLMCFGRVATQNTDSAISSGFRGYAPL